MIIWNKTDRPTADDILEIYKGFQTGELRELEAYHNYYEVENKDITEFWRDRHRRHKTPNNLIPTAYYKTAVDSEAGYMFNNVAYEPETEADSEFADQLNEILTDNNADIKDMKTGINSLYSNKGIELVYTVGDGKTPAEIKYTSIDPRYMVLIYTDDIEPTVLAGVYITIVDKETTDLDVIYADEWQYYRVQEDKISTRKESRRLYFSECPVCVYRSDMVGDKPPFHQIIKYIDALDMLLTGNSNEVDKLFDVVLLLGKTLTDEQKRNMAEWKVIEDLMKEDRAEYLERDMSPEFRAYVSKLLIEEIYRHAHIVDWTNTDTGTSGPVSAKALKTKLFDMNMYANRILKVLKEGSEKRIRLITEMMVAKGQPEGKVNIIYNYTMPSEFEDLATTLKDVGFLSNRTKWEKLGIDADEEQKRMDAQKPELEPVEPDDIEK